MPLTIDYSERVEKIRRAMRQAGVDAVVCTRLQSIAYVAGVFAPAPWRGAVLIPMAADVQFIAMGADLARTRSETWIKTFHVWDRAQPASFVDMMVGALREANAASGRVALEMRPPVVAGLMTVPEYLALRAALPRWDVVEAIDLVDSVMVIKEPAEVELIRRAAEIGDYGLLAGFRAIRPGATENQVAGAAERALRDAGSSWSWAETGGTEVGSGERSAYAGGVCQPATNKVIQWGDTVVVDVHPTYELYTCDTCGTALVGRPTDAQRRLERAWQEVTASIVGALRPDASIGDVARAGLKRAEALGYLEFTVPTFGHGLGTCVGGLAPFIWEGNRDKLQASTLVIVLTAIAEPRVGGARLELPVMVTEDEPLVLGRVPVAFAEAG